MNQNEERKTTELELGQETNTSGSGRRLEQPSSGNSFYDRQNDNNKTVWYKDWRGKTLGITLAALVLIGVGIPSGMAAAGYWAKFTDDQTGILDGGEETTDKFEAAQDKLAIMEDKALMDHYQLMVYEGLVTPKAHDNAIDDANDNADEAIKSEKDSYKDQYGNTWEEEWNKNLQNKGFATGDEGEQEYKDSIVADSIKGKITSAYSSNRNIKKRVPVAEADDYIYHTDTTAGSVTKAYVVKDSYDYPEAGAEEWYDETNNKYSYTPQDLMTMYLMVYQPIMFNDTLLPFIPVVGNGTEANIQGNNVSMSNDDVKAAWSFARMDGDYQPAAKNYGGIQPKGSIGFSGQSLGEEANLAVMLGLQGLATDGGTTIKTMVDTAFGAALSGATTDTVTSNMIINMTDDEVNLFEQSLVESLKTAGLLNDPDEDATKYRNWSTTGIVDADTYSFISTNGLHNIGVQLEGKELVTEQLNNDAGIDSLDVGLFSNFNTWFSSAFNYITMIDYITDPVDTEQGWFDYTDIDNPVLNIKTNENFVSTTTREDIELTNQELGIVFFSDFAQSRISKTLDIYEAGKSFAKTNWKQFDSAVYSEEAGANLIAFENSLTLNKLAGLYFDGLSTYVTSTKVIDTKRGDE